MSGFLSPHDKPWEKCSLFWKVFFYGSYSLGSLVGLEERYDPRIVGLKTVLMHPGIARGAILLQTPQDLEPAFAQTAQGTGMAVA